MLMEVFCKTDKYKLLNLLERGIIDNDPPQRTDVIILDGFFMSHLLKDDL